MHGGLYIEMASFFVSRIVAGLNVMAGLMVAILIDYCNP
jgi:hypothetical protein